jgi:hypothetical protein
VVYSSAVASYYITCWVQGEKLVRCGHQHGTIGEVETCHEEILGRFIRVVEGETERSLNDDEFEVWRGLEKKFFFSFRSHTAPLPPTWGSER